MFDTQCYNVDGVQLPYLAPYFKRFSYQKDADGKSVSAEEAFTRFTTEHSSWLKLVSWQVVAIPNYPYGIVYCAQYEVISYPPQGYKNEW